MVRYSQEFKDQAVKLSDEIGVKKSASQLAVSVNTVSSWRKAKKKMGEGKTLLASKHRKSTTLLKCPHSQDSLPCSKRTPHAAGGSAVCGGFKTQGRGV